MKRAIGAFFPGTCRHQGKCGLSASLKNKVCVYWVSMNYQHAFLGRYGMVMNIQVIPSHVPPNRIPSPNASLLHFASNSGLCQPRVCVPFLFDELSKPLQKACIFVEPKQG